MDFKKVTFLKVYTGEDVIVEDMPLFKAVIKEAMRLKLAGGTVTRGIGGYASVKRGIDYKIGSFIYGAAQYAGNGRNCRYTRKY